MLEEEVNKPVKKSSINNLIEGLDPELDELEIK